MNSTQTAKQGEGLAVAASWSVEVTQTVCKLTPTQAFQHNSRRNTIVVWSESTGTTSLNSNGGLYWHWRNIEAHQE
ncbi:hypothetical protein M3668_00515 [Rothia sp. P100]|uniref:hypothetical protein n=1 Tax=Rothia sp. P100 TaxID=2939578 RepID=UPI00203BC697|nr:hypothetical protein [Rothia sp. P100]MCM3509277.1 hypothetical protein [Rothia sp. P100]